MSLKWGGQMNNKCIYYVEGPCEQQLIAALKESPSKLIPGKVRVYNVVQNLIPKSQMLSIQSGTTVVLAFDTDVENLEDELVRSTDVKSVIELTKSKGIRNFKTDFCKLKTKECRTMLERHGLKIEQIWSTKVPEVFSFAQSNSDQIKLT